MQKIVKQDLTPPAFLCILYSDVSCLPGNKTIIRIGRTGMLQVYTLAGSYADSTCSITMTKRKEVAVLSSQYIKKYILFLRICIVHTHQ